MSSYTPTRRSARQRRVSFSETTTSRIFDPDHWSSYTDTACEGMLSGGASPGPPSRVRDRRLSIPFVDKKLDLKAVVRKSALQQHTTEVAHRSHRRSHSISAPQSNWPIHRRTTYENPAPPPPSRMYAQGSLAYPFTHPDFGPVPLGHPGPHGMGCHCMNCMSYVSMAPPLPPAPLMLAPHTLPHHHAMGYGHQCPACAPMTYGYSHQAVHRRF
ncbi:uncharacterized protein EHS24_002904 [Apiotrichum porosum]|uniref:Uncharacterized protein n=1 Tax=Apiotrichum porosum TaxID=105984 RepID=A0A427XGG1_9TREE|nr:uncharacterized protein EHS24_002904 [Apiotrichum porosum]RSH77843.1 hypothetical protein EHS24_002904 [Apiotrichum porosum]